MSNHIQPSAASGTGEPGDGGAIDPTMSTRRCPPYGCHSVPTPVSSATISEEWAARSRVGGIAVGSPALCAIAAAGRGIRGTTRGVITFSSGAARTGPRKDSHSRVHCVH